MKKTVLMIVGAVLSIATVAVVTVQALPATEPGGIPSVTVDQQQPLESTGTANTERHAVIAEAVVVPSFQVSLSPSASGTVSDLLVREGDEVTEGQPLLHIQDAHNLAFHAKRNRYGHF